MLTISPSTRISLCTAPIDMRKSFDGLLGIVRSVLEADPLADHLSVFLNRHHALMKILYWDGDGFAIWYKRLERGTFRFPANIDYEFEYLCDVLDRWADLGSQAELQNLLPDKWKPKR